VGDLLKQQDLIKQFSDSVAIGGWSMDGHPPEASTGRICRPTRCWRRQVTISLRSLYSPIFQLMMAGAAAPSTGFRWLA
jgi:hypothetical protein